MGLRKKLTQQEDMEQFARDFHDHNFTDLETLNRTLFAAIEAMEEANIPHALIGGVAVKSIGRPRVTHDVDFFVRPDDADKVLEVLNKKGFSTEVRDPFWLYKAWREEILVDVIFKSSGDIYFDEEVQDHVRRVPYNDRFINAISPEDFIVIKSAVHQEHIPHHWHDALAVLTQGDLDWDYLLRRARHAPRRVLSLLIYAQSNDIAVPNEVIQRLYRSLFEAPSYMPPQVTYPYRNTKHKGIEELGQPMKTSPIYLKGKIMEALTDDQRIAEHDIKVYVSESTILTKGEVFTNEQKEAVDDVISKIAPEHDINNQIYVRVVTPPEGNEVIS